MAEFFSSGRVADLILACLAAEAALLAWLGARGRGPGLLAVLPFLLAGAAFALALRGALTGAAWPWVATALAAAFAAHLWDLAARGRR